MPLVAKAGRETMQAVIDRLLGYSDPCVRFRTRVNVLGEDRQSESIRQLQGELKRSDRVTSLLSERTPDGTLPYDPYAQWYGPHWVLVTLADIGYPPGDTSLFPLREQVLELWLSPEHIENLPVINGRTRVHASQEANALFSLLSLGLDDERIDQLAQSLMRWQWPDGGWNCDMKPEATHSSFWESLIPLRALALYGRERRSEQALEAARRAAEVFLRRRLFRRERDGAIMNEEFLRLHYPWYWGYDILFGLKVMAEAGFIGDARCREALEALESKRLDDGGFPAEEAYYHLTDELEYGRSVVDWGGVSKTQMNEFVTADALYVLGQAGRPAGLPEVPHRDSTWPE